MEQHINFKDIPKKVLEFIEAVSTQDDLKGRDKKQIVLDKIIKEFNLDLEMVLLVSDMIDIIVDVSKNRHKIKKRVKSLWSVCF